MPPPELNLKKAQTADADAIARVHVASWHAIYPGIIPSHVLDALTHESSRRYWGALLKKATPDVFVAESRGAIVAYCVFGASRDRDADASTNEIYAFYVHPESWRQGVGRRLLLHVLSRGNNPTIAQTTLWLAIGNHQAEHFYRAIGFTPDSAEKDELVGGEPIRHLRFVLASPDEPSVSGGPHARGNS